MRGLTTKITTVAIQKSPTLFENLLSLESERDGNRGKTLVVSRNAYVRVCVVVMYTNIYLNENEK